jgi:hypothetical protein
LETEIHIVKKGLHEILNSFDHEGLDNKTSLLEEGVAELFVANKEDTNFFATFLNNSILKPITKQIEILEAKLSSASRSNISRRKVQLKIIDRFKSQRIIFLRDYHRYLKGFSEYEDFIEQQSKLRSKKRDFLLSTKIIDSLEFNSVEYFKRLIDESYKNTFEYFKNDSENTKDIEISKQELLLFVRQLEETKDKLKMIILKEEAELSLLEKTEVPSGFKDYELENGDVITVDLFDQYVHEIVEKGDVFSNYKYQQTIIEKLSEKLYGSFLFLQEFKPFKESPKTVFHSLKFEELNPFCEELREFIGMQLKLETIKEVFTVGYSVDNPKINLTNGNLNDFGCLISKMKPSFINSIKANYSTWWAERFTFNSIDKNKKSVSNLISNIEKGKRFSSKSHQISEIINSLKHIPQ